MKYNIFAEYEKLAVEKGLVSDKPLKKNANEKERTKEEISAVEMLYGINPNKSDKDIIDQAHPETAVVAPAYDKMNGVVENVKERQSITTQIALKDPNGLLMFSRYVKAQEELLNELISTAFLLDKNNEVELMKDADECSGYLTKNALLPAIPIAAWYAIATGAAALGGILYSSNNPSSHSLREDALKAKEELEDAMEDWDYPQLTPVLAPFMSDLNEFISLTESFNQYNNEIYNLLLQTTSAKNEEEKKKTIDKDISKLFSSGKYDQILKNFNRYKDVASALSRSMANVIKILQSAPEKYDNNWEWTKSLIKVKEFLVQSDIEDAVDALMVFQTSLNKVPAKISEQIKELDNLKSQVDSYKETVLDQPEVKEEKKSEVKSKENEDDGWV
jgi:hypothetical protein